MYSNNRERVNGIKPKEWLELWIQTCGLNFKGRVMAIEGWTPGSLHLGNSGKKKATSNDSGCLWSCCIVICPSLPIAKSNSPQNSGITSRSSRKDSRALLRIIQGLLYVCVISIRAAGVLNPSI
jgi:hypothetical protein